MSKPFSVLIVGAGIGGLALAQLLRAASSSSGLISVTVVERDANESAREQGYVIGLNPDGLRVIRQLCPQLPALRELIDLARSPEQFLLVDSSLREYFAIPAAGPLYESRLASRWGMRGALAANVPIKWNKQAVSIRTDSDAKATVQFADGTSESADLVVAADGARSPLRQCVFPDWRVEDVGVTAVGGSLPLVSIEQHCPQLVRLALKGFLRVFGDAGHSYLIFSHVPASTDQQQQERQFFWSLSWPTAADERRSDADDLFQSTEPAALLALMRRKTLAYFRTAELLQVLDRTPPQSLMGPKQVLSMQPRSEFDSLLDPLLQRRLVLLGDAAHAMTTHRGAGANCALADAADLSAALLDIARNGSLEGRALRDCQRQILRRGHRAASESLSSTRMIHATSGRVLLLRGCILNGICAMVRIWRLLRGTWRVLTAPVRFVWSLFGRKPHAN